jgi:predicted GIY-YIG superfamily endonuclease
MGTRIRGVVDRWRSLGLKNVSTLRMHAYVLEHKIKGWRREKKLALISGRYNDLPRLSRSGSHKYPASGVP